MKLAHVLYSGEAASRNLNVHAKRELLSSRSDNSIPRNFWISGCVGGAASRSGRFALEKHLLILSAIES
jgi:hypothetical protein